MPSWHAKFSASAMERIEQCPGSVELSKDQPDRDTPWSIEGTKAHKVHEVILKNLIYGRLWTGGVFEAVPDATKEMLNLGKASCKFILDLFENLPYCNGNSLGVETKVTLPWLYKDVETGGTYDARIVEPFGTLHIFDYKFGAGHAVSPTRNLQMVTYSVGTAHQHHWNFEKARHWIIQPRIKGYDGPLFWDCEMRELKDFWAPRLRKIVKRAIDRPKKYVEGPHCHWCRARPVCPLKRKSKEEKARNAWD